MTKSQKDIEKISKVIESVKLLLDKSDLGKENFKPTYDMMIAQFMSIIENNIIFKLQFIKMLMYGADIESDPNYIQIKIDALGILLEINSLIYHDEPSKSRIEYEKSHEKPRFIPDYYHTRFPEFEKIDLSKNEINIELLPKANSYRGILKEIKKITNDSSDQELKSKIDNLKFLVDQLDELEYTGSMLSGYQSAFFVLRRYYGVSNIKANDLILEVPNMTKVDLSEMSLLTFDEFWMVYHIEYLKSVFSDRMDVRFSIENSIDRFKNYVGLYTEFTDLKNSPERLLQYEFEKFLFNEGFYPLSEGRLKNNRFDTLSVSDDEAFLVEYKQYNLGETNETERKGKEKIINAGIQTSVYSDLLNRYPKLVKTVFIIIFSNEQIRFVDNLNTFNVGDVTYIYKPIQVLIKNASRQNDKLVIDINSQNNAPPSTPR